MSLVMFETIPTLEVGSLDLTFRLKANIQITAKKAQQLVSIFVGNQIADLLYGGSPDLIIRTNNTYWRVPVTLSLPSLGRMGVVGVIEVHVETGELQINEQLIKEIKQNAQRLATSTTL